VGNLSAWTFSRSSVCFDLKPILAGRFPVPEGNKLQPAWDRLKHAANKADVNTRLPPCLPNSLPCARVAIMRLVSAERRYGSKRFCSNHSLGERGFFGSSLWKIEESHEGFGSSFGGLIQGLVGVVVVFWGADFLKVNAFPILLKNFLGPVVILFSMEGLGLFCTNGVFFVLV
jgi:hypothetical protein